VSVAAVRRPLLAGSGVTPGSSLTLPVKGPQPPRLRPILANPTADLGAASQLNAARGAITVVSVHIHAGPALPHAPG
jgi:hypothetical protein